MLSLATAGSCYAPTLPLPLSDETGPDQVQALPGRAYKISCHKPWLKCDVIDAQWAQRGARSTIWRQPVALVAEVVQLSLELMSRQKESRLHPL